MQKSLFLQIYSESQVAAATNINPDIYLLEEDIATKTLPVLLASKREIKVGAVVNVFNGSKMASYTEDMAPVDSENRDFSDLWYKPVCPTHQQVRKNILDRIISLCNNNYISEIWLDFFYYPANWTTFEPSLYDTCYCPRCMEAFSKKIGGEKLPEELSELALAIDGQFYQEWLEFKAGVLCSVAKDISEITKSKDKKLGLFCVPWLEKEFGSGLIRVLGQNLFDLASYFDFYSPMLFTKRIGKTVESVPELLEYEGSFGPKLNPSILYYGEGNEFEKPEFEKLLQTVVKAKVERINFYDFGELLNFYEGSENVKKLFQNF